MGHFALITEGYTDQIVIKCILLGLFESYIDDGTDPIINFEQPPTDETSRNAQHPPGGWTLLEQYFKAGRYKQALQTNKYLIIQIDTDRCEDYGVSRHSDGKLRTVEQLVEAVSARIRGLIDEDISREHGHRFILAIAVDAIECWFLPLVFPKNQKSKTSKTTGCLKALNYQLRHQGEPTLTDADNNVNVATYKGLASQYMKKKKLDECCKANASLGLFVAELTTLINTNPEEFEIVIPTAEDRAADKILTDS